MRNRWNIEITRGMRVAYHLPRGGIIGNALVKGFERMPGYGWRVRLDAGTCGIDDVIRADHVTVTLRPTQREVGHVRNGRPGYRWAPGYVVIRPDGAGEYPPVSRVEAYGRARELGATRIVVGEG